MFAAYMVFKTMYAWLLLRGALEYRSLRPRYMQANVVMPIAIGIAVAGMFVITTRDRLGFAASLVLALGFGAGAILVGRIRDMATAWLVLGFSLRALLGAAEAIAYGLNVFSPGDTVASAFLVPVNTILAAHYSLDTAAEWLVAMGCVIAVSERSQRDLKNAHTQLLAAHENLRRLADRDPLTALRNRRSLPEVLRAAQPQGASLIFFDLDGFKRINDEHGHQSGDQCLIRFAAVLTRCFRPTDAVIRYGGDEFLVVANGLDHGAVSERVQEVRAQARAADFGELPTLFSYGVGHLAPGGNPDDALRAADEAMYRDKRQSGASAPSPASEPLRAD